MSLWTLLRRRLPFPVLLTVLFLLLFSQQCAQGPLKAPLGEFHKYTLNKNKRSLLDYCYFFPHFSHTHTLTHTHIHAHPHRQGRRENVGGPRGEASGGRYSSDTFQQEGTRKERERRGQGRSGKPVEHWESCSWLQERACKSAAHTHRQSSPAHHSTLFCSLGSSINELQ